MDNTFFIFFSDNGTAGVPGSSSGPLRGHKFDEWDGGVHAPAVLYWKKAEKQYKNLSSQVTGFVDLVPTLKDLVGDHSRPKREYDGISILPVLNGKKTCIDRDFYLGHGAVVSIEFYIFFLCLQRGMRCVIGHIQHKRTFFLVCIDTADGFFGYQFGRISFVVAGFPVVVPVQFTFTRQVEIIYRTVQMTIEAIRCIDAYEKEGPFMLYVAYNAPHTPLQAQEKDIKLYTDNFDSLTPKEQKKATYSAMVSCMDRGIGAIVDALKKKGIMDNTFFIFFSDNGTAGVPVSYLFLSVYSLY